MYGGLVGADTREGGWWSIPKPTIKPSIHTVVEFLDNHIGRTELVEAVRQLEQLGRLLDAVKGRSEAAGKLLVTHLNTPPAPTFAPLVTTLVALLASVHSEVSGEDAAVRELTRLLRDLSAVNARRYSHDSTGR